MSIKYVLLATEGPHDQAAVGKILKLGGLAYPEHKVGAEAFIDSLSDSHRQHWRGFDHQKAVVASITSVLKPGAANTSSIAQDGWLCEQTIQQVAEVAALKRFIDNLLAD